MPYSFPPAGLIIYYVHTTHGVKEMKMKKFIVFLVLLFVFANAHATKTIEGFVWPESVAEGPDGLIYVSEIGARDVDGDGKISKIDSSGKRVVVAKGLYDPKGIVFHNNHLYVTDRNVILKVSLDGKWEVFAAADAFPQTPVFLNDIEVSPDGDFYITDTGDFESSGVVFAMDSAGKVTLLFGSDVKYIDAPNGLLWSEDSRLLIVDWGGNLLKADLSSNKITKIGTGFPGGDGLAAAESTIYITSWTEGKLYAYKLAKAQVIASGFEAAADIALSRDKTKIILPDMKAGTVSIIPIR